MTVRIGLVHALGNSMAPVETAFAELWPEAETIHLYDQSLYPDFHRAGELTQALAGRVGALLRHSESCGAHGIVFTGSLFGSAVEETRKTMAVPVLGAYEAMIETAFAVGTRLAAMATVADTLTMMRTDIERYASAKGSEFSFDAHHVAGALEALQAGNLDTHDRLIAEAAADMTDCDVLMLGQFTMSTALPLIVELPGRTVLSSPHCAAVKLKGLLTG